MAGTLTRKDQVRAVLQTGGHVKSRAGAEFGFGLVYLFDGADNEVPAWQQAIKASIKPSECTMERVGAHNVWRLRK